jgi:hypothetical protein
MLLDQVFGTMDHFAAIGCHEGYLQRGRGHEQKDKQQTQEKKKAK